MRFCPLEWLMRKADRSRKAASTSIPAPVRGLNTRDALAAMDPLYASEMVNYFPTPTHVEVRKGYAIAQTIDTGNTAGQNTNYAYGLIKYGDTKLFMTVYDTTSNEYYIKDVVTGTLTTIARPNMIYPPSFSQFTNTGGTYVCVVLRETLGDNYYTFDGTNWVNRTATLNLDAVAGTDAWSVATARSRLWFLKQNSLNAYYLPTSAITGTTTKFPLGGVATKGGYLRYISSWTRDGGEGGSDDLIVFVTSAGQAIVYQGTDPSSSATWGLVGVFTLSPAVGRPLQFGPDLLLPMEDGLYSMTQLLSGNSGPEYAISDVVRQKWQQYVATGLSQNSDVINIADKLSIAYSPKLNQVAVMFPNIANTFTYAQQIPAVLAMNTISKAWTEYTGFAGFTIEEFGGYLYTTNLRFVTTTWQAFCYKFGAVDCDQPILGTTGISAYCRQAYNYLGMPGTAKQVTIIKPSFTSTGTNTFGWGVDVDFVNALTLSSLVQASYAAGSYSPVISYPVMGTALAPFAEATAASSGASSLKWYSTDLWVVPTSNP